MSDVPLKNPGWAGNTGEFDLTEEEIRGEDFIGERPLHGGHSSVSATMPYMLIEKNPEAEAVRGRISGTPQENPYPVSEKTSSAASSAFNGSGTQRAREP